MDKKEFKDQIKSIKNNLKALKKTTKDNRLKKFIGVILSGGGPSPVGALAGAGVI